jgi:uncharacterized protein involved in outer membrane biogenesis
MASRNRTSLPLRRVWLGLLGLLLALVVAFGICQWIEWPFLRGPLERALSKGLARPVTLGEGFGLRLLGDVHLHDDRLAVGPGPETPQLPGEAGKPRHFLTAQDIRLALPYSTVWSLIRGRHDRPIVASSLEVAQLELNLLRDAEGRSNWHFGTEHDRKQPPLLPHFGRFVVQNGMLHYDDAITQVQVDVALRTHEGGAAPTGLEARATGRYRSSPLSARLESAGLLPLVNQDARAAAVPIKLALKVGATELDLDGKVADLLQLESLDGSFNLVAPSLAAVGDSLGLTLPNTAPFRMDGRLGKSGEVWSAHVANFALGTSRLDGDFRYDRSQAQPKLSGRLGGKRLALPDLAPAFGAPRTQSARAEKRGSSGLLLPQREFDIPSLAAMDADVSVAVDTFFLGTPRLESLAPLNAHVVLKDQRLTIENLDAKSAGGEVRGAFSLDARERKNPQWSADLRWSGIELARFIKVRDNLREDASARAEQRQGKDPGYVSGALSGRTQLRGEGRSTARLLASLDGTTQMWVKGGRVSHLLIELSGIDLAESLGIVLSGDSTLPVQCALARLKVADGVLTPEVAVVDTTDTTLVATGSISLADEQLHLLVHARPHDMTPVALRGPLHIEGTFAHPNVHLDRGQIGIRVAAAAALATLAAPLASLLAFIDVGDPQKAVCSDALARMREPVPRPAVRSSRKPAGSAAPKAREGEAESPRAQPPATHRTLP